jgi:[acyl-carrier-protein] S-malonyltransferase
MLADFAETHPKVINLFQNASDILGYDLWELIQHGPVSQLNQTQYTQPALLTASIAIWNEYIKHENFNPIVLAGHSLGEYSALVASGSLNFTDAVSLVAERGRLMQEAVPVGEGAMAAVLGLDNEVITQVITQFREVQIANYNAIGQTVIAGRKQNVLSAVEELKTAGAKLVKLLDVSVPSHCSLMASAAEKFDQILQEIKLSKPLIPVIHNYSVELYDNAHDIRHALSEQLTSSVRWVETIEKIYTMGIQNIYEFGPGDVLTKLCKRINKNVNAQAVNSKRDLVELF